MSCFVTMQSTDRCRRAASALCASVARRARCSTPMQWSMTTFRPAAWARCAAGKVRLFTRNGHDWTDRFPLITEAAQRNRIGSFVIDGEAVLLGVDGRSDFNGLHSRKHDDEVQLYAFDVLMSAGDDVRPLPLHLRKNHLAKMLRRRVDGIILNDFEQGEIGPDLFRHACLMGLEGIVSKHKDQPYRAGRSKHWIKVKNRTSPAMNRPEGMF